MTDLRAGATNLFLPTLETEGGPRGKFLDAIRKAAAGEFEILAELGRRADGGIAYLARDLSQPRLVALRLERQPGSRHDYVLNVLQELDGSLPATGAGCIRCSKPLRGWGRYCPHCGFDLSGMDTSGLAMSGVKIQELAEKFLGEECRVLGRMGRAEGGGTVVFAKPANKDTVVGLRLRRGEGAEVGVDRTFEVTFLSDTADSADRSDWKDMESDSSRYPLDPTVHADPWEVATDAKEGMSKSGGAGVAPSKISPLTLVLIVVAAVILGMVLGAFLL